MSPVDSGGEAGGGADDEARLAALVERLSHVDAKVRRVAAADVIALAEASPGVAGRAHEALLARLGEETDVKTALRIIRRMAEARWRPAVERLRALYDDGTTPVEIAIAAIRAADEIEGA